MLWKFLFYLKNLYCNGAKPFYTTLLFWLKNILVCLLKIPSLFKFSYIVLHKFTDRQTDRWTIPVPKHTILVMNAARRFLSFALWRKENVISCENLQINSTSMKYVRVLRWTGSLGPMSSASVRCVRPWRKWSHYFF